MSSNPISGHFSKIIAYLKPPRLRPVSVPMAIPLAFLLTGIIPVIWLEFDVIRAWHAPILVAFGVGFGFWLFAVDWRVAAAWTLVGLGLAAVHANRPWNRYRRLIPEEGSFVEAEIVLTDTSLVGGGELEWLNPSKRVWATIERMRVGRHLPWTACGGRLQVYAENTVGMTYGDRYRVTGALRNPMQSSVPGGFDQRHYLKLKGVEHSLHVIEQSRIGGSAWRRPYRWLLQCRAHMLRGLLRGIGDREKQGILAGLVFGCKHGINPAEKRRFLLSGMIHLLAVSGLHVGILSTIIILMLKILRVPYRARYAILPLLLLAFVLMTGAGVSAVRAWLMITVWSVGKSMMKPSVPVNAVFTAAFIVLLLDPVSFLTVGFQFSFLLVIAILCGWRLLGMLWRCIGLRSSLVPSRAQREFRRRSAVYKAVFMTCGAMLLFWLAGLGLTIHFNGFVNPMGIVGNVCVTAMVWVLMACSWMKIVLECLWVPIVPHFLAWSLSALTGAMDHLSAVASSDAVIMGIGQLPRWWFPAYHASIMLLVLSPPRINQTLVRLSVPVLLAGFALGMGRSESGGVDVLAVSGNPVPVVCIRDGETCTLINAGTKNFVHFLGPWLESKGIRRIDRVILLDARVRHSGGVMPLLERYPIDRVDVLAGRRPRKSWRAGLISRGVDLRFGHLNGPVTTCCAKKGKGRTDTTITLLPGRGRQFDLTFVHENGMASVLTVDTGNRREFPLWYYRDDTLLASIELE